VKTTFCEADLEQEAHRWLASLGWQVRHGLELDPGGLFAEREGYQQVVLADRLRNALLTLNPDLPAEALEDAYRKVLNPQGATLEQRNRAFHRIRHAHCQPRPIHAVADDYRRSRRAPRDTATGGAHQGRF
jgi:type I restriction enzyme R subunit